MCRESHAHKVGYDLGSQEHKMNRASAGMVHDVCERHGDISFATNIVLRQPATPTPEDDVRLKNIGKSLLGALSGIQEFKRHSKMEMSRLAWYVDGDWSSDGDRVDVKHWC